MSIKIIDPDEIRRSIDMIQSDIFECRIIQGRRIYSGYFKCADVLISELLKIDLRGANVYTTIQKVHPGCEARLQWETFFDTSRYKIPTTSDNDIISFQWLPIDLDPVRPAGISSSQEELGYAGEMLHEIMAYMQAQGFKKHIVGFSGNGYHLLYDIANQGMKSDDVASVLHRLDELFSNDAVHVDTTVSNKARIWKLYGTLAQKGRNTAERPFRLSKILRGSNEED